MRITKQLIEYLQSFELENDFEIANTIADYKEKKHKDIREIPVEIWELAKKCKKYLFTNQL